MHKLCRYTVTASDDVYSIRQYNVIVPFRFGFVSFRLCGKVESFKRTIRFVCLFNCLVAERRKNDWIEKNDCAVYIIIRLGAPYKRVALGRIRCFCLSQAARDVQQVQETTTGSAEVASSSSGAKEQLQEGAKEQQQGANHSSSFYSATNRFAIVLFRPG